MEDKTPSEPSTAKKRSSLSVEDFTIRHRLGKGAYGDVFLVIKNSDHKEYALKQIQKRKLEREQKEYQAHVEKELLSQMKHPGIIKLRYSFQDKSSLYFVQEYCQGGEFISFIKSNMDKLTEPLKVFYIAQIVKLLEYLHQNGVTHRDLKPQNLMLDKRGHLKLIDFGTAEISQCKLLKPEFKENIIKLKAKAEESSPQKDLPPEEPSTEFPQMESPLKKRRSTFVGTCYYISPQLLEQNYCPPSADLWALGCIIYQLYYLQTPFKDSYEFAVFEKIKKAEVSFPKNDTITEEAIDLIKKLLVKNPEERLGSCTKEDLSFDKLKSHSYFKNLPVDFNKIFEEPVPYISGLHAIDQDKKEAQENLQNFKGQEEKILKSLTDQGKQIIKHEIVQEKSFIIYSYALLVLCSSKEIYLITADQPEKKRKLAFRSQEPFKILNQTNLLLFEERRTFEIRTAKLQEWVQALKASL